MFTRSHPLPTPESRLSLCDPDHKKISTRAPDRASMAALKPPTIFHEKWWLDAATAGQFREAVTHDTSGSVTGQLSYFPVRKRNGQSAIVMPTLTHMLGPVLSEKIVETNISHVTKRLGIIRDLVTQLPRSAHISFL